MKIVALNEIHYIDRNGKAKIASPAEVFDVPAEQAESLLDCLAARRMTKQEIEIDKLRAAAMSAPAEADEDEDEDEDEGEDQKPASVKAPAKAAPKAAAKVAAKPAAKGDGGY